VTKILKASRRKNDITYRRTKNHSRLLLSHSASQWIRIFKELGENRKDKILYPVKIVFNADFRKESSVLLNLFAAPWYYMVVVPFLTATREGLHQCKRSER